MFSIVVYANMKGIYSSRGIEEACRTDIRFMWLLQYRKAPDHTTISRFLENNMSGCAEDLFYQLIEKLAEMGEIDFGALFIDGTKIEANAKNLLQFQSGQKLFLIASTGYYNADGAEDVKAKRKPPKNSMFSGVFGTLAGIRTRDLPLRSPEKAR